MLRYRTRLDEILAEEEEEMMKFLVEQMAQERFRATDAKASEEDDANRKKVAAFLKLSEVSYNKIAKRISKLVTV